MRRRNFVIAAVVAALTFFTLQAFVRPYVGNRLGWWGYQNRYYDNGRPGWGHHRYYDERQYRHYNEGRSPYDTLRPREDSTFRER